MITKREALREARNMIKQAGVKAAMESAEKYRAAAIPGTDSYGGWNLVLSYIVAISKGRK